MEVPQNGWFIADGLYTFIMENSIEMDDNGG